jgi:hypothetical protein
VSQTHVGKETGSIHARRGGRFLSVGALVWISVASAGLGFWPVHVAAATVYGGNGSTYCASNGGRNLTSNYADVYTCGPAGGGVGGPNWQCTEYSARYFQYITQKDVTYPGAPHYPSIDTGAHFAQYVHDNYPQYPLGTPGPNQLPSPGDIVSMWGPSTSDSAGHTGVIVSASGVNSKGTGTIKFYDQNATSNGVDYINVNSWVFTYGKVTVPPSPYYYDHFNWLELGSTTGISTSPAATTRGAGMMDAFFHGTDNAVYHYWWWNGAFGGSELVPGMTLSPGSSVGAVGNAVHSLDIFARGTDGLMYGNYQGSNGVWVGWTQYPSAHLA